MFRSRRSRCVSILGFAGVTFALFLLVQPSFGSGIVSGTYGPPFTNSNALAHVYRGWFTRNATLTIVTHPSANRTSGAVAVNLALVERPRGWAHVAAELRFSFPIAPSTSGAHTFTADWFEHWADNITKGGYGPNNIAQGCAVVYVVDRTASNAYVNTSRQSCFGTISPPRAVRPPVVANSTGYQNSTVIVGATLNGTHSYMVVTEIDVFLSVESRFAPNGSSYFDLAPPYGAWLTKLSMA